MVLNMTTICFVGNADLIRCHHCGIGLKDWSDVDDPLTEHVRYAPDCQFLIDTVPVAQLARIKVCCIICIGNATCNKA